MAVPRGIRTERKESPLEERYAAELRFERQMDDEGRKTESKSTDEIY